ncbi:MAG: outer membrane beta-barrel protein [Rikenellaceae bacterium]
MKKFRSLLLLVAVALFSVVSAEAKILGLGVTGGINNTDFSIKGEKSAIENGFGYQFGATLSVSLPFLSLSPEVLYTSTKFDITKASILGDTASVRSNAVEIPIMVGLSVLGPLKIEAGPKFTVYDSAKASFDGGGSLDIGEVRSSAGYVVGLKLSLMGKLTFSARYNGQFDKLATDFNLDGSEYKIKCRAYTISAGYIF